MENFVVSARKYRPHSFESVVGQEHITTTLKNAVENNHLAQAFLFCGPRGVGKTTCARILAKLINTPKDTPAEEVEKLNFDYNIYELDAASNNSVDDIRSLVDQVRYAPQSGKYKVYIIDEVHMLSNAAFNAFLKTLEEPPAYAIFILATTEKHKVIPTILSRCQIFDFNRISVQDIAQHLATVAQKEGITAEEQALYLIAQKADGALRDALSLFDMIVTFSTDNHIDYNTTISNLHILDYDYYFKLTDALLEENHTTALLTFDDILSKGFDGHNFIIGLCEHFRNLLVCKDASTIALLEVAENVKEKYHVQSKAATASFLLTAMNIGNQCDLNYKTSKNQRFHVELALLKMCHVNNAIQLATEGEPKKKSPLSTEKKTEPQKEIKEPAQQVKVEKPVVKSIPKTNPIKVPLTKTTRLTTDLNKVREQLKKEKEVIPQHEIAAVDRQERAELFSQEQLQNAWDKMQESDIAGNHHRYKIILEDGEPEVAGKHSVVVNLHNQILKEPFDNFKPAIFKFLANELSNDRLHLESKIAPPKKGKKLIYTSHEKFEYLAEKNPALNSLRKKLGFEFDE